MNEKWYWLESEKKLFMLLESKELWGYKTSKIWIPGEERVVQVSSDQLKPGEEAKALFSGDFISYAAASGKLLNAFNSADILLAPMNSAVLPLPHQIHALQRALFGEKIRFLLADEVGLGKTIEAGLIIQELKLRGVVKRVLIVAPKGLISQWESEMKLKFSEDFKLVIPSELSAFKKLSGVQNAWELFDQVICPIDSVKPIYSRQGWSNERLQEYNQERFLDLVNAGWDLIVVDEAHKLGGTNSQVARHRLGQSLAQAAPYILLLSATPHQGKSDAFLRLMSLLDPIAFTSEDELDRDTVSEYVLRTEKRKAIDIEGKPLFKKRNTSLVPVYFGEKSERQKLLYEAVTAYVREGYRRALNQKQNYIGFLMLLMQRLVASSTAAIARALEKRLEALSDTDDQMTLPLDLDSFSFAEFEEMNNSEEIGFPGIFKVKPFVNEAERVRYLLGLARAVEFEENDAKALKLLEIIQTIRMEEMNPEVKILIFTEFVATQKMLQKFLEERGFSVCILNGSMSLEERLKAQRSFAKKAQILISTDAGGEGLNLQFCHVVVNYDMPWNPMKIEQRIGRVDRIGKSLDVKAFNLAIESTVEFRVIEVIQRKLQVILDEFGVDKTGDVLDSTEAADLFDDIFVTAIADPENLEKQIDSSLERIRQQILLSKESGRVLPADSSIGPEEVRRLINQPVHYWLERAVVSFVRSKEGKAVPLGDNWKVSIPGEIDEELVSFSRNDDPDLRTITFNDPLVRSIVKEIPQFPEGLPVPIASIRSIPKGITGIWSLWRVTAHGSKYDLQRVLPVFVNELGELLHRSADLIWMRLIEGEISVISLEVIEGIYETAERRLKETFDELKSIYYSRVEKERNRKRDWFRIRRRLAERSGLSQVIDYRVRKIDREFEEWSSQEETIIPQIDLLLALVIKGEV